MSQPNADLNKADTWFRCEGKAIIPVLMKIYECVLVPAA